MKIIFASFSKKNFYLRAQISAFILSAGNVPISPFMNFEYNLSGTVNKDLIRIANNTMIKRSDELWVFGPISDGVLIEIFLAKKAGIHVKFFKVAEKVEDMRELKMEEVELEDVSPWMWEWVVTGKNLARWHPRLRFNKNYPLVYPAYSKKNFYWQMHISKFCIEKKMIPLNPFMLFRYFLSDTVPRDKVYEANAKIIDICDELWVFGDVADGVWDEVKQIEARGGKVKYFKIINEDSGVSFRKIRPEKAVLEGELKRKLSEVKS